MAKLDTKRKVVLFVLGFVFIIYVCAALSKPSRAIVQPAPAPALQGVPAPSVQAEAPVPVQTPAPITTAQPLPDAKAFTKFAVYQDNPGNNHYVLSGFMPQGKCIKVNDYWEDDCQEGQKCLEITYDTVCSSRDQGWAGAYWLNPANNWGNRKGGYDLTGARTLIFWARGKRGGEVIDAFKIGGVMGADQKFPDSDMAGIGPVTLTKEWQQYSIDLKGKDLSHIGGGFAWAASVQSNPQPVTFYLDNVYYE